MKKISLIIFYLLLVYSISLKGQSIPQFMFATAGGTFIGQGDLKVLGNGKTLNIFFTYDSMGVDRFSNEADFLARVKNKLKDEADETDLWLNEWKNNKTLLFEPAFLEGFNKVLNKYGVNAKQNIADAQYTIQVSTTFIHTGWTLSKDDEFWLGSFIANNESEVQLKLLIFEGINKDKIVAKFNATGFFGGERDYSETSGARIASAYTKAGKEIGKFLYKRVYKGK